VPPDNSGIGILSQIITAIEAKPYSPDLTPINRKCDTSTKAMLTILAYFTTLQCAAEYGPDMDSKLRKAIKEALGSKKAAKSVATHLANQDIAQRYLMQTSQAVDIISGGVKINALPEKVYAVVNHRIAVESSTSDIKSHVKSVISSEILPKFSFSLDAWGDISGNTSDSSVGRITLSTFDATLEPAPVSPSDTDAYKTFTGTIKQVFGKDVIVAPSLMTGNTDTKFYWGLTKNIYRFSPVSADGRENAHTVDERIGLKEHIEGVKFYTQLILNGDV
jgi:Gly-Xaa carboxypeptidase